MCLSSELCELRTFPHIVQELAEVAAGCVVLCERMCRVNSDGENNSILHTGHTNLESMLSSLPPTGRICGYKMKRITSILKYLEFHINFVSDH